MFLLRRRNVPLTGESVEVLRLHMPQTCGLPRRPVRKVSLAEASSKAGAGHLGVVSAARRPPHSAQRLARTAAPYERRDGDRRLGRG
jgi:hypothetical protein